MSNKLFKGGMNQEMLKAMAEQKAQYACLFALAVSALNHHGGSVTMLTEDINVANMKGIRFAAVDKDGKDWVQPKGWEPNHQGPVGIRCYLEDVIPAKGPDA